MSDEDLTIHFSFKKDLSLNRKQMLVEREEQQPGFKLVFDHSFEFMEVKGTQMHWREQDVYNSELDDPEIKNNNDFDTFLASANTN